MIDEELEFLISQYADGSCPADRLAYVEAQLASDAARAVLEDYRRTDVLLKSSAPSIDTLGIRFDALASHLSSAVADEPAVLDVDPFASNVDRNAADADGNSRTLRLVSDDALASRRVSSAEQAQRSRLSLRWVLRAGSVAAAACVALAAGLVLHFAGHGTPSVTPVNQPTPTQVAHSLQIEGPRVELAQGPSRQEIEIGPPPAPGAHGLTDEAEEAVVSPNPTVVIASGTVASGQSSQDASLLPF